MRAVDISNPRCRSALWCESGNGEREFPQPEMFKRLFLGAFEKHRAKIGPLIFEFSTFHPKEFERGRDFGAALDQFLAALPRGWDYGIELRNKS